MTTFTFLHAELNYINVDLAELENGADVYELFAGTGPHTLQSFIASITGVEGAVDLALKVQMWLETFQPSSYVCFDVSKPVAEMPTGSPAEYVAQLVRSPRTRE